MRLNENLRQNANIISKFLFCWMTPLFWKGFKRDLDKDDLGKPLRTDTSKILGDKLERNWFQEIQRSKKFNKKPSLLRTLVKTYVFQYLFDGFLVFIQYVGCKTFQPLLLAWLLEEISKKDSSNMTNSTAEYLAGAVILLSLLGVFIQHHTTLHQQQLGMRLRISCCSLIYRKMLRLNSCTLNQITVGRIVNLMSNDVIRFDSVLKFLHILWIAPIQILLCFYLYSEKVSPLTFIGVLFVMLPTVPLQSYISKLLGKFRLKIAKRTDERVKKMNEIICGIQTIKMYAWEEPFEKEVQNARSNEIKYLNFASYLRGINASFLIFTERASLYVTLLSHVILEYSVTAPTVYSLSQFYNMLQTMLTFVYPHAITASSECLVSVNRIQDFLLLDENLNESNLKSNLKTSFPLLKKSNYVYKLNTSNNLDVAEENLTTKNGITNKSFDTCEDKAINIIDENKNSVHRTPIVEIKNVSASWNSQTLKNIDALKNITINFEKGKLYAIIGSVGSGKSSLLQLILKEIVPNHGSVRVNGRLSYACQEPWLFLSTVKENILFGLPYDPKRYKEIVRVCALEKDFRQLPQGDKTIISERGISLSGGQRARINLARAIYRQVDIYLLDDPLSGVDMPVGNFIFRECFVHLLKDKTRIIITHNLQYLRAADYIIIFNNGMIEKKGTYENLINSGHNFSQDLSENDNIITDIQRERHSFMQTNSIREISRRISIASIAKSELDNKAKIENKGEEEKESGMMPWSIYWKYWAAGQKNWLLIIMIVAMILNNIVASSTDYWVTYWTNQNNADKSKVLLIPSELIFEVDMQEDNLSMTSKTNITQTSKGGLSEFLYGIIGPLSALQYVYVYTVLIVVCITLSIFSCIIFYISCMNSSFGLHKQMFAAILRAPMKFFDSNPSGRILNRFSKDLGNIDESLPKDMLEALQIILFMISALIMVTITNTKLLVIIVVLVIIFFILLVIYLRTAQDIKRLEGITRSPVFSHACCTVKGISTIRSADAQSQLSNEFDNYQDTHTAAWYQFIASRVTLGFWLDITGIVFVACVTFSFIYFKNDGTQSGDVGLAISQSLMLTSTLRFGVQQLTDVVSHFTSCERILQYTNIEREIESDKNVEIPPNWPSSGLISFNNISLAYSENHKPVLENFNVKIEGGWKVGIVGRTGAGKSSLIAALFRLANIEGNILIDDLLTRDVLLKELRSKISIIPQEPILFSATMRYNLDPFKQYDDALLWEALESVYLKDSIPSLDYEISEGGSNFSLGQRQLVCLARAVLKNNKILVLDEATANMDPQTDNFIQKIIRERFSKCTVLTIAHRLNTIMDADRILVMEGGKCVEFDHPYLLLQTPDGHLYSMVKETGTSMSIRLHSLARRHYEKLMLKEKEICDKL